MRERLTSGEGAFQAQVEAFIGRYWPVAARRRAARERDHPAARRWRDAVAAEGWSVPAWPVAHGGTGWSPQQLMVWLQQTAAAGTPPPDPVGTEVVGPLLCAAGTPAQQAAHLPGIRAGRVGWCLALEMDPDALAVEPGSGSAACHLSGRLPALPGAAEAAWLLCRAGAGPRGGTLVMVDLAAAGVHVQPQTAWDGTTALATLQLDGVAVPAAAVLGEPGAAATLLDRLPALPGAFVPRAPALQIRVREVRALAEALEDDVAWQTRLAELEIELAGLEGLEWRALAATGREAARLGQAAALRRHDVTCGLTELATSLLGYYALPFPEARLIDNEGPIGHDYALAAVTARLRAAVGRADTEKNRLARWLAGP